MALAAIVSGCGGDDFLLPTGPTPQPQTVVFTGTLAQNGGVTHNFAAQAGGSVTATLVAVEPETVIGLSLGTWNGVTCQIVIANDAAVKESVVIGTVSGVGELCVRLYDVGQVMTPTTYEVSVFHP